MLRRTVLVCCTLLFSQGFAKSPDQALLRLKGKKGDGYSLKVMLASTVTMKAPDGKTQTFTSSTTMVEKDVCTAVAGDNMTWTETTVRAEGSGTGPLQAQAQSWVAENKGKVVTKVKTSRNQVIKGSEKDEMPFEFPAQAVEPGFSWTQPGKLFGPGSSVTYKLTKIGTYAGKAAAFLSLTPSNSKARIVSPLIFILDLSNGWFLKASGAFEVPIQPGVKLTTSLNVTRV